MTKLIITEHNKFNGAYEISDKDSDKINELLSYYKSLNLKAEIKGAKLGIFFELKAIINDIVDKIYDKNINSQRVRDILCNMDGSVNYLKETSKKLKMLEDIEDNEKE